MAQPLTPIGLRQHLYPDSQYGGTPELAMPDGGTAASKAARLMVKLGVDGRGPRLESASPDELAAASRRLEVMQSAARTIGFAVDIRLAKPDGTGTVRAYYTYTPQEARLIVADRPPLTSGRMFNLRWALDDDGPSQPIVPAYSDAGASYLEACSQAYDELYSSVMGTGQVVRARLTPYQSFPS